jgi:hypothetical protein
VRQVKPCIISGLNLAHSNKGAFGLSDGKDEAQADIECK